MLSKLLEEITLDRLHEAGITDQEIDRETDYYLLDKWLTYQGIVGFTSKIQSILVDLISSRESLR